jgi:UDP-2-acetamido-2-deoxy-ribo-hexuluronate aminotransferase
MTHPIQFVDLRVQYAALKNSINARIQRVLDHCQQLMGQVVAEHEQQLTEYSDAKYCISVGSGTSQRSYAQP